MFVGRGVVSERAKTLIFKAKKTTPGIAASPLIIANAIWTGA